MDASESPERRALSAQPHIIGTPNQKRRHARPLTRVETVSDLLYASYANLASIDAARSRGLAKRDRVCWMIRAKLLKGLRDGTMTVSTLFADVMMMPSDQCVYCGATPPPKLHGDHLIPRHRGGPESGDNLVWACRSCNSSKNDRDLLEWYAAKDDFPTVSLMRRYLKLALAEAESRGILGVQLSERPAVTFSLDFIPLAYPEPGARSALTQRTE